MERSSVKQHMLWEGRGKGETGTSETQQRDPADELRQQNGNCLPWALSEEFSLSGAAVLGSALGAGKRSSPREPFQAAPS